MNLALHLQQDANIAILMQDSITTKFAANNFNCMPSTQHMCDSITLFQTKKSERKKTVEKKSETCFSKVQCRVNDGWMDVRPNCFNRV